MDSLHDEIVTPSPFAQAILTFRGSADGEEALHILRGQAHHIDLILSNKAMPRMSGVKLLEEAKEFARKSPFPEPEDCLEDVYAVEV